MRLSRRRFLAVAAVVAAAGAVPAWVLFRKDGPTEGERPEHVILVDWDGLDPTYLDRAPTPNIDALAEQGSLSIAQSTFPTISNPARASMSTGAYPEIHGNLAYYLDRETGRAVGEDRTLSAETVMEALVNAGKTVASVQWYMVQNHGVSFGDAKRLYVEPGGLFGARVDAAIDILEGRPVNSGGEMIEVSRIPDFMAVYGSDLDDAGQAEGPDGPNIGPLLAEMDRQLGRLVQATRDAGISDRTAFILTGDHGMTGWERDLTPDILKTLTSAGYAPEAIAPGGTPKTDTEVVLTTGAIRTTTVALKGPADTAQGRGRVKTALKTEPHVASVLSSSDLEDKRVGDKLGAFVVEAEEPWGFAPSEASDGPKRGAHGSTREMKVPLLLAGAGFRRGVPPHSPRLVDVAPTICALLQTRPPGNAQGRILSESLEIRPSQK